MPLGDGTGPYGTGPEMGWRRGRCYSKQIDWPVWRATRMTLSPKEELQYLTDQESMLQDCLSEIIQRKKVLIQEK